MKLYIPKGMNMRPHRAFVNRIFNWRLNEERIRPIRDMWKGKLVMKGIYSEEDTEKAIRLALDGLINSNHGGRQLYAGTSTIKVLQKAVPRLENKIKIMMDRELRTCPDIARPLACGV